MLTDEISSRTQQVNVWGGCLLLLGMLVLLFVPLGHDAPEGSTERDECQSVLSGARSWQDQGGQDTTMQDYSFDSDECAARRTAVTALLPVLAIPTTLLFVLAMRPVSARRDEEADDGPEDAA